MKGVNKAFEPISSFTQMTFKGPLLAGGAFLLSLSLGYDYYTTHKKIPSISEKAKPYIVDASPIGKKYVCYVEDVKDVFEHQISIFSPRNGSIVHAVPVPGYPNFVQVDNGLFLQIRVCGKELVKPLSE